MSLAGGAKLGPYEIVSLLGTGGMGEVYRARDPRLGREVAIKILSAERMDEEHSRRFLREARAASALNHPNIVTIHEIESADGRDFIVMEYVAGKSLDRLIPRQGMPLGEVLRIAIPIADALARAHGRGIAHRDVKPSNVIVSPEGVAKLLDFGLAKLVASAGASPEAETETAEGPLTRAGAVSGTVGYMSPEQASGRDVDVRTDVFSFGALLYEMVTGHRAFTGDSAAATLAAVMREQPKTPSEVAPDVPRDLEKVILRCLRKEADRRYQSMADVTLELEQIKEDSDSQQRAGAALSPRRRHRRVAVALAAVLLLSAGAWLVLRSRAPRLPPPRLVPLTTLDGYEWSPTFSPDGEQVAFSWNGETWSDADIYIKMIGASEIHRLTTDPAEEGTPSWSPDGRQIAFTRASAENRDGKGRGMAIHLVSPLGGPARRLSELAVHGAFSWSPDGQWLAATRARDAGEGGPETRGIYLLPVSGAEPRLVTRQPPPGDDASPAFSPDGHHLAYVSCPGGVNGGCDVHVLELGADLVPVGPPRRITRHGVNIRALAWTRDGASIVYCVNEAPYFFHLWRAALRGDRAPERIELAGHRAWTPSIARSRDRLAFAEALREVDVHRFQGVRPSQVLVASSFFEGHPRFSPDGRRIAFASTRSGVRMEVWLAAADGSGPAQLTNGPGGSQNSPAWSPEGQRIAFDSLGEDGRSDIWTIDVTGGAPRRLTHDPGDEYTPSFSRDGRWVYFYSERDGGGQIWRVPAAGGIEERVTRNGAGRGAIESVDGRTLFFKRGNDDSPLLALPLAGGAERTVAACVRGLEGTFDVVASGVYYPDCSSFNSPMLHRLDPATGRDLVLGTLDMFELFGNGRVGVSPDGRAILYTKAVRTGSDLMLIEGFR